MTTKKYEWTKQYCGIQHLGNYSKNSWWCTVIDHDTCATLAYHSPQGYKESTHSSATIAREVGEKWYSAVMDSIGDWLTVAK